MKKDKLKMVDKKKLLDKKLSFLIKNKDYNLVFQQSNLPVFSSGSLIIDSLTGIKGFPTNSMIEIFGQPSTGKTTLALYAIKSLQKISAKKAIFFDIERTLNLSYAQKIGVNLTDLVVLRPKNAEETFDLIIELLETNEVSLIVLDSVAALLPESEKESKMSDNTIGLQARIMSKALRKINFLLTEKEASIIFINQMREKIKMFFGNPATTTGGNALKFYTSLRVELKQKGKILDSSNQQQGIKIGVKIVKNKLFTPFATGEISIFFGTGISFYEELFELALKQGHITKKGGWYFCQDKKIGHGKEKTLKTLETDSSTSQYLKTKINL